MVVLLAGGVHYRSRRHERRRSRGLRQAAPPGTERITQGDCATQELTMRRLLLVTAALIAATIVLMPEDASAYWRGGWRGPAWGGYRLAGWGGYRPIYGPWAGAPVIR